MLLIFYIKGLAKREVQCGGIFALLFGLSCFDFTETFMSSLTRIGLHVDIYMSSC